MLILADESCPGPVVRALRDAGHDVLCAREIASGLSDEAVLAHAAEKQRVLVALDRDFGELVVRAGVSAAGVVLIRLRARDWQRAARRVVEALDEMGEAAIGSICTIDWATIRYRRIDDPQ